MRWLDERRLFNEPERWVDANMERNAMLSWFWPRLAGVACLVVAAIGAIRWS